MKVVHRIAQLRMPLLASDGSAGRLADHVESCISCQAEASRYRAMQRMLSTFSAERYEPPFDLVPGVMSGLDRPTVEARRRVKAGAAAAVAGAVAGAVVIARVAKRRAA